MGRGALRYDRLIEDALKGVVRQVLSDAAEHGLPASHHFYITFKTTAEGVDIPDRLHARFPEEMTIVLQHQFWGLEVEQELFRVTLSFDKMQERLTIPFSAVTVFADPSVQFGLQFQGAVVPGAAAGETAGETKTPAAAAPKPAEALPKPAVPAEGRIVTLDAFRKK
jgi:uncharacterized protein